MIFKKWAKNKKAQLKHYSEMKWLLNSVNNKLDRLTEIEARLILNQRENNKNIKKLIKQITEAME